MVRDDTNWEPRRLHFSHLPARRVSMICTLRVARSCSSKEGAEGAFGLREWGPFPSCTDDANNSSASARLRQGGGESLRSACKRCVPDSCASRDARHSNSSSDNRLVGCLGYLPHNFSRADLTSRADTQRVEMERGKAAAASAALDMLNAAASPSQPARHCLVAAVIVEQVLVKLRAHAEDVEKEA